MQTSPTLARFEWRLRQSNHLMPGDRATGMRALLPTVVMSLLLVWLIYRHIGQPKWLSDLPPLLAESMTLLEMAALLTALLFALILLWRGRQQQRLAGRAITSDDLYALSPKAFERYVAGLFRKKGYKVRERGGSGDHGVDLELEHPGGRHAIVQCKRYRNAIGPDIVRELFGTMIHEGVHHAFLVTTAEITPAARDWAQNKPMTLIDGPALVQIAESLRTTPAA